MRLPRTLRAAAVAGALLLVAPAAAVAHDDDRAGRDRDRHLPTSYVLDPAGVANPDIFPEGVAARGDTFYVGSTTDGTVYRGDVDEPVATPFLLAGKDGRTSAVGMKVDGRTLFVAGGATGRVFAYDTRTGELTGSWTVANPTDPANPTFLNDLVVTRRGDVYVTDSRRPVLYRIDRDARRTDGVADLPVFLSFEGTPVVYGPGFNVGGIAASPDGRTLVLAQSNARALFRVDLRARTVTAIDLGGEPVGGDGLVLVGRDTLYAVERQGDVGYVVTIDLDRELRSGTVLSRTTDASFDDPTTAARVGRSLLVVNSQFGARNAGVPPTPPFTVSRVPLPRS
jgi:sugar lactone lactonase YvrE